MKLSKTGRLLHKRFSIEELRVLCYISSEVAEKTTWYIICSIQNNYVETKMTKNKQQEKRMITDSVSRRPYGAKLSAMLDEGERMILDGEICLLTATDYIVKMHPKQLEQADNICGVRAYDIYVEGFATAGEAERVGLEITFGILWGAISGKYSLRLQYQTPLPCVVYDRNRSGGSGLTCSGTVILGRPAANVAGVINEGLTSKERGNRKLLLAMELFSSARQELTERSRFISVVSSLEPLAEQQSYGVDVSNMIDKFTNQIKTLKFPSHIEASLIGRTENLSIESVMSAIRRLIRDTIPGDSEAVKIIEDAYDLRSRILHDGTTDADLSQKSQEVEAVIRKVIAAKAGLALRI